MEQIAENLATETTDPRENLVNPLLQPEASTPEPQQEPEVEQVDPELAGLWRDGKLYGKFDSLNDVAKSYGELERQFHMTTQELAQAKRLLDNQIPPQPEAPAEPSMEEIGQMNEDFLARFYDEPIKTLAELAEKIAAEKVRPITERYEQEMKTQSVKQQIMAAANKFPDFHGLIPEVQKIIAEQGKLFDVLGNVEDVNPVEIAYSLAKARQAKPPEAYLQDPGFRQKILQDEDIRQEIIKSYANAVKQGQPPTVIGAQTNAGIAPATPPVDIKSTTEAKKASMSYFSKLFGG